jgi:hypothetical protein
VLPKECHPPSLLRSYGETGPPLLRSYGETGPPLLRSYGETGPSLLRSFGDSVILFVEFVVVQERVGLGTGDDACDIGVDSVGASGCAVLTLLRILAADGLLLSLLLEGLFARALGLRGTGPIRHNGLINLT